MAKIFGFLQLIVLIAIGIAVYLRWRRHKDQEEAMHQRVHLDPKLFKKATGVKVPESGNSSDEPSKLQIASAFPSWSKDTPLTEILGVSDNASKEEIEKAFKARLKEFHPDRFAHWGKAYQERAHYTVLLIQKARDVLLKQTKH